MNRTDFNLIAQDLRVSPDDLDRMVQVGPHGADELPKLLQNLGSTKRISRARSP